MKKLELIHFTNRYLSPLIGLKEVDIEVKARFRPNGVLNKYLDKSLDKVIFINYKDLNNIPDPDSIKSDFKKMVTFSKDSSTLLSFNLGFEKLGRLKKDLVFNYLELLKDLITILDLDYVILTLFDDTELTEEELNHYDEVLKSMGYIGDIKCIDKTLETKGSYLGIWNKKDLEINISDITSDLMASQCLKNNLSEDLKKQLDKEPKGLVSLLITLGERISIIEKESPYISNVNHDNEKQEELDLPFEILFKGTDDIKEKDIYFQRISENIIRELDSLSECLIFKDNGILADLKSETSFVRTNLKEIKSTNNIWGIRESSLISLQEELIFLEDTLINTLYLILKEKDSAKSSNSKDPLSSKPKLAKLVDLISHEYEKKYKETFIQKILKSLTAPRRKM